ncbi:MAG: 50S ribosomal protein L11 methyltransferase [Acidobacteria bacterium]|nr:50S ribosomal protein L11 methyltransferase [Acidobacteriota bacterium]
MKTPALIVRFSPERTSANRDLASAALLEFDTAAIHEVGDDEWRVFFRTADERDRAMTALATFGDARPIEIDTEDWARRTQETLRAVVVGDIVVAPPWDVPGEAAPKRVARRQEARGRVPEARKTLIVIEPSMGFGTAHHATTRLCLLALQEIDLRGRRVLDVGTGSGVLAIAAAKRGAAHVVAVDNDPDALAAARDNVSRNGVDVDLRAVDLQTERLPAADVVLANLTGAMLRRTASDLAAVARGGTLILSGLLTEEAGGVRAAFARFAASIDRRDQDGWSSLVCTIP